MACSSSAINYFIFFQAAICKKGQINLYLDRFYPCCLLSVVYSDNDGFCMPNTRLILYRTLAYSDSCIYLPFYQLV